MNKFITNLLTYYLTEKVGLSGCVSISYKVVTLFILTYYLTYYQVTTVRKVFFMKSCNEKKTNELQRL